MRKKSTSGKPKGESCFWTPAESSRKNAPRKIAPWKFVARKIAPRKIATRKIPPMKFFCELFLITSFYFYENFRLQEKPIFMFFLL